MVNDFWFHTVWAAKKILRGETWVAAMCVNGYLKSNLLRVMEIDARARGEDPWHAGRFMEKWALEEDAAAMKGKRVLIVDDVISTGESLLALEKLVQEAGGIVCGKMAILAEGDAQNRDDIIYLEKLPLFNADGSVK